MTPPTPDLVVDAGGPLIPAGHAAEVPGRGDLRVRVGGQAAGAVVELWVGERLIELVADEAGSAEWVAPRLLGQVAGELRVSVGDASVVLQVRPDKLRTEAILALVAELEAIAEGLAQDVGGAAQVTGVRSREHDLQALEAAVGRAADAAAAIRRRPIHRRHAVVRAVPRDHGPRSGADVRWLATHPVAAIRAGAGGRAVGVVRQDVADLDTLENRGVLAAYDRLEGAVAALREVLEGEFVRLGAGRAAREAFLTETSNLWEERDRPRFEALVRRRARLVTLAGEAAATRTRAGLPDLRPRGQRMVRTARVDAEPAYWSTYRAFEAVERIDVQQTAPAPAPVRTLDELWELWATVAVLEAVEEALGPPASGRVVDPGWFSTLRQGELARWETERATVQVLYEPAYAYRQGALRKLIPGRPWRPDVAIEVRWRDGAVDLHVLDAKYRLEAGGPPKEALRELWWRYGEGIGTPEGRPVVRSLWVVAPGDGLWLVGPGMLDEDWPPERLRGGCVSIGPGRVRRLCDVLAAVLT